MDFSLREYNNDICLGEFSLFNSTELVSHAFSARFGGVSEDKYSSLNLALHVGDDVDAVIENRKRLCGALGLDFSNICTAEQVHEDKVCRVRRDLAGRGALSYADAVQATDALITNERGIPLMLCFADCVPVMFLDPVNKAVGVAHAGWKGTVKKIAAKTILRMGEEFGTKPENVFAVIGPSIGPESFDVGEDVAEMFSAAFQGFADKIIFHRDKKVFVDLWSANCLQLEEVGMKRENIACAEVCTSLNPKTFFSYRYDEGVTGRFAAIIALK